MQELKPYHSLAPLKRAIDNGGRFYNFFDKAENEEVSRGELAKAAGVFTAGIEAYMFLEMAQQELGDKDKEAVLALLQPTLRKDFLKKKPPMVAPSVVESSHKAGQSVIISGYTKKIEDKTQFTGFIMIPIMVGKVMTMVMVPIYDQFNVYEVFDDQRMCGPCAIVAVSKKKKVDFTGQIQFGGVLKKVQYKAKEPKPHTNYLEVLYYVKR